MMEEFLRPTDTIESGHPRIRKPGDGGETRGRKPGETRGRR
jgi:hypothetical protein